MIDSILKWRSVTYTSDGSIPNILRKKRINFFKSLLGDLSNKKVSILDIGGTEQFWTTIDPLTFINRHNIQITLLNLNQVQTKSENIKSIIGDACDLSQFNDGSYDIVFSNSVIEHVGDFERQTSMAREIRRVGRRHFVQTPNYFFLIEPHSRLVGIQFLPLRIQKILLQHIKVRGERKFSEQEALKALKSLRLLTEEELIALFPSSNIYREKFCGITKSFIIYAGLENR